MLFEKYLHKKIQLLPIDFKKSWWQLIMDQKFLVLGTMALITSQTIFWYLTPFLLAHCFTHQSISGYALLFIGWTLIEATYGYARTLNARFQLQCIHSIYQNAHQHLLTIDPLYHVHRSSGAILSKIERGARGYEDLLDEVTKEFMPLLIGIVVMIIALVPHSKYLAAGTGIFFVALLYASYYLARHLCQKREQEFITTDDDFKTTAVENLAQVHLVRSTFASDYMSAALTRKIEKNVKTEGSLWLLYITNGFSLNLFYLASIFIVIIVMAWQLKQGLTTIPSALGLMVAYIQSTRSITKIASPFRRYMRSYAAVKDLFAFMASFGEQTYPVLGPVMQSISKNEHLAVTAHALSFGYQKALIFNNHSFELICAPHQKNKLYGIIGASGSGKTTLLSILGGQLKPTHGTVKINDIDIYAINDATRRTLIALQGQVATSVKGTIKYNMLFGLPENHGYTDQHILDLLKRVGLQDVLEAHNGLETMLGEGGLNLSGGQRQRLNFATLYLRATYYRPLLILIDEPTSSLDEISELAITRMIEELATHSITLVIAHRLKTIEKAAGLIDLSLLKIQREIKAYTPQELQKKSVYYAQLMQGKIHLDN